MGRWTNRVTYYFHREEISSFSPTTPKIRVLINLAVTFWNQSTSNIWFLSYAKMRALLEVISQPGIPIPISQGSNLALAGGNSAPKFLGWLFECHGFWHNVALIVASFLFVLYLALKARENLSRLSHGRSYIMVSYYGCLWLVSLLNLAWCCLQVRVLWYNFFLWPTCGNLCLASYEWVFFVLSSKLWVSWVFFLLCKMFVWIFICVTVLDYLRSLLVTDLIDLVEVVRSCKHQDYYGKKVLFL